MNNVKDETEGASESEQPKKKLLLEKRVLRHFNVRTSVQTGRYGTNSDSEEDPGTYSSIARCR